MEGRWVLGKGHKQGGADGSESRSESMPRTVARYLKLYVADVSGDWREEIIVISGNELHIYENPVANPRPKQPRLWDKQHYRRAKMSWNYYSP